MRDRKDEVAAVIYGGDDALWRQASAAEKYVPYRQAERVLELLARKHLSKSRSS